MRSRTAGAPFAGRRLGRLSYAGQSLQAARSDGCGEALEVLLVLVRVTHGEIDDGMVEGAVRTEVLG